MGNSTSSQCPKCHRLKTLSPKKSNESKSSSTLKCSAYGWEQAYNIPNGFEWCQGESPTKGGERGAWMVSIIPNTEQASDSAQGGKSTKAGESDEDITMDIS